MGLTILYTCFSLVAKGLCFNEARARPMDVEGRGEEGGKELGRPSVNPDTHDEGEDKEGGQPNTSWDRPA